MSARIFASLVTLAAFAGPAGILAAPVPRTQPRDTLDRETVRTYEALGATYGGLVDTGTGWPTFHQGLATEGLPAFRFRTVPTDRLPRVDVPFGLVFERSFFRDGPSELRTLDRLEALSLVGGQPTAEMLDEIARCPQLKSLECIGGGMSPLDIRPLNRLRSLERLSMLGTRMEGDPAARVPDLANLRSLAVTDELTPAGLQGLQRYPKLTMLFVSRFGKYEPDLRHLATLEHLGTDAGNFTPAGLRDLARVPNLRRLSIRASSGPAAREKLAALAELDVALDLDLQRFENFTDCDAHTLRGCRNLTDFSVWSPALTDAGVAELAAHRNMRSLRIGGSAVTDAGLEPLLKCRALRSLSLAHTGVTNAGVATLAKHPSLESWDLCGTEIGDGAVTVLKRAPRLRELDLEDTDVSRASIAPLKELKTLRTLNVLRTNIWWDDFAGLGEALPGCEVAPYPRSGCGSCRWRTRPVGGWKDMTP